MTIDEWERLKPCLDSSLGVAARGEDPKPPPRFKVGDRVRVVRLLDEMTSRALIGFEGKITEIDDIVIQGGRVQTNYEVDGHYMHDEELEPVA